MKLDAESLAEPVTSLIKMCIETYTFPEMLNCEVMPAYKKGDVHDKNNYRTISILSALSKVFEGMITDQLRPFLESVYSHYLSGFRKIL